MIASPSEMTYIPGGFFLLSMSKFTGEYDMCIHVGIWMDMEHEDTWNSIEWNGSHALYTWFNIVLY